MSAGTKIVCIRIPDTMLVSMDVYIANSEASRFSEPHTRTSWILSAIRAKLDQAARTRRAREKARESAKLQRLIDEG